MQSVNKIKGILNGMHVKKLELKKLKNKLKDGKQERNEKLVE
jgi:hypothetical protein